MTAWMVRAEGGDLFDAFLAAGLVAIDPEPGLGDLLQVASKSDVQAKLVALHPGKSAKAIGNVAAQCWRFVREIAVGDTVVTYEPRRRIYALGQVTSPPARDPTLGPRLGAGNGEYAHYRRVAWTGGRIARDALSSAARNTLGSSLTVFRLPERVEAEMRRLAGSSAGSSAEPAAAAASAAVPPAAMEIEDDPFDLTELETRGRERIKDRIAALDWNDMQRLVAGILRTMGYKTRISGPGSDRGLDILASPDGLGLAEPRIAVEVKHRPNETTGAQALRSFIGGRHEGEKGLYVSTGGFTKEARYEAARSKIPRTLLTLEELVELLLVHYDRVDDETRQVVPLRQLHWPVD